MRFGGIDGELKVVGSMVVEGSTPSLPLPRICWRRRINDTGTAIVGVQGRLGDLIARTALLY
jgi:hypothetical protein